MITVTINGETRDISEATEVWLTQQVNRRRRAGQAVCVQVSIALSGLNMRLATPGCAALGSGGGRPPNANEREVFELWDKRGLNRPDFSPGSVVAFLKQFSTLAAA